MSSTWFTADLHIGHKLVSGLRGFETPLDHDQQLAANWDSLVRPGDQVWILGDISVGSKDGQERALDWVSDRVGAKHLISGNHDSTHPMHRDSHKWVWRYMEVFESVNSAGRRRHDGKNVLLSHMPYVGDHTEVQRFDQWRLSDHGLPILHGHTHQEGRISHSPKGTLQIHVGLDAWGLKLVHLSQIQELLHV